MAQRIGAAVPGGAGELSVTGSYMTDPFGSVLPAVRHINKGSEEPAIFSEAEGDPAHRHIDDGSGGDDSTFKILIVTDTHLGYKGEDPVRGNDSFRTFEEILHIGRSEKVDFVLHAGDLFDENKPSRTTLYRAMCLLRKYCFGSGTVQFDVLSASNAAAAHDTWDATDSAAPGKAREAQVTHREGSIVRAEPLGEQTQTMSKDSTQSADVFRFGLNYLNENVNVCMPIFAMHGNHDDPGDASHLSPLDILEAAHLINYFGRVDNVEDIRVRPILLRKGNSKVTYEVPADGELQSWFNVLLVHQNMYKGGHGGVPAKNCVLERMLPSFADVVIWGHEHDCHTELRQSQEGRCQVLQPGSSIATSLTAGEAQQKHVFILDVRGDCFRIRPVPLHTVRPMIVEDVCLANICGGLPAARRGAPSTASADPREAAADREAWEALTSLVEDILRRYSQTAGIDLTADAALPVSQQQQQQDMQREKRPPAQPRRRQAYQLFCNYRAGATQDLIAAAPTSAGGPLGEALIAKGSSEIFHYMEDASGLSILSEPDFNDAVQDFAIKMDPSAISAFVTSSISAARLHARSELLKRLKTNPDAVQSPEDVRAIISEFTQAARIRRLAAADCDNETLNNPATEGALTDMKQNDRMGMQTSTDAGPSSASEVEKTLTSSTDLIAAHGVSTDSRHGLLPAAPRRRVPLDTTTGGSPEVLQVSEEEEEQHDSNFSGACLGGVSQKPSRRGAPKKQPTGGRGRGRKGATTQSRKNIPADVISSNDSQEEEGPANAASEKRRATISAASRGVKQQRDIRSLLSQLSGKRGIQSQAASGARSGNEPPDVPTQESDTCSLSHTQCAQRSGSPPPSAAPRRQQGGKRLTPPRPPLPLGTSQDGGVLGAAPGRGLEQMGSLQSHSWTKRARPNETYTYQGEPDDSESGVLQNSLFRGADDVPAPHRPESRTIGWKRR